MLSNHAHSGICNAAASKAEQRRGLRNVGMVKFILLTQEAETTLVSFCLKHPITHLDVHIRDDTRQQRSDINRLPEAFKDLHRVRPGQQQHHHRGPPDGPSENVLRRQP